MPKNLDLNKVDREKLLEVVNAAGLEVTEQTAYTKCTFEDRPARIYIANTQKVTRVDLSGFTVKRDGINQISREEAKELKLGNVQGQLDFTQDEDTILKALEKACEALKAVEPKKKKEKKAKPAKTEETTEATETLKASAEEEDETENSEESDETENSEESDDDESLAAARRDLIRQRAQAAAQDAVAGQ